MALESCHAHYTHSDDDASRRKNPQGPALTVTLEAIAATEKGDYDG
jgi:hypothetical protein